MSIPRKLGANGFSTYLDCAFQFQRFGFLFFIFFLSTWTIKSHEFTVQRQKSLFMHYSSTVHVFENIKNRSHDTIHTFKNYFTTVFSVSAIISLI